MTYPPALEASIRRAAARLNARLGGLPPTLASRATAWVDAFTKGHGLATAVMAPASFPMMLALWWAREAVDPNPEPAWVDDLVYSAFPAYLFIRLIDDVMDGDAGADPKLLPLAGVFHQEFQSALARWFPADAPFWAEFIRLWDESAAVTVEDASAASLTEAEFRAVSGRKCLAAGIQVAAVFHRAGQTHRLAGWLALVDELSLWHQFGHDLFDWKKDLDHGTVTWFLSEARRRKDETESVEGWVFRQGMAWGRSERDRLTQGLADRALALGIPGLAVYLAEKQALDRERFEAVEAGLAAARKLFGLVPPR
jgi:hypothetical protein